MKPAWVIEDDLGQDLSMMRQRRYRFFYRTDELKLVKDREVALRPLAVLRTSLAWPAAVG